MNYFFGISNNQLKCKLTVPKFQNQSKPKDDYKLYMAEIIGSKWKITKVNCNQDNYFYYIVYI